MSGDGRFKVYDVSQLRGRVPSVLLENYLDDPDNIEVMSFISGLQMSCGDFETGVRMNEEIVEKAGLGGENLQETNIAVWSLYILSKIYIEQERFDKAYRALDNAERYWSKDLELYDSTGIYRVRNIEELWLRRAFGYLIQGRKGDFESMIDRVMLARYELYSSAYPITGETPLRDLCLLDCFEYSSYMCRNSEDLEHAMIFIKTALEHLGRIPVDNSYIEGRVFEKRGDLKNAYSCYLRFYLTNRPVAFDDHIKYGRCISCAYFETPDGNRGECKKHGIEVDGNKSCGGYLGIPAK